jgi:hypothetical protein
VDWEKSRLQLDLLIDGFLKTLECTDKEERQELLRDYILWSDIGQKVVVEATLSVVENLKSRSETSPSDLTFTNPRP